MMLLAVTIVVTVVQRIRHVERASRERDNAQKRNEDPRQNAR